MKKLLKIADRIFGYGSTDTRNDSCEEGFQRRNSPRSPIYTEQEMVDAILRGTISEDAFKSNFEWMGENPVAAASNVTSAVLAAKKLSESTQQLSQGAQASSPATTTPAVANPTGSTLDRLFSQIPAGSWRYDGFTATGEPVRRVLFWAKAPTKLIIKTADQAKKLIDDDDADKSDFGWYLVSGWVSSSNGHFKPTPDTTSRVPF